MKINSIAPVNNTNLSFQRAKILKSAFLDEGFKMALKETESPIMKDLNRAKAFFDNMRTIGGETSFSTFKIDAEKGVNGGIKKVFTVCDNENETIIDNHDMSNTSGYLCMQGIKDVAAKAEEPCGKTYLDTILATINNLQLRLVMAKEEYAAEIRKQLKNMQDNINR